MTFRNDIQFLRGISVIAVILFHLNNSYLPGGFLGVDIFFIISGYLITNIIIKKKINNKFSLKEFYFARAKRILPTFFFVLIITYIICYLTFLPSDLKIASRNSFFINLFLGNFNYYYFSSDYFSIASSLDPHIHLWTLSLEEQFYILYPLLFIFFFKKNIKLLLKVLFLISIISILFYLFSNNFKSVFYLLHGRIWQLMLGGIISIIHLKKINYKKKFLNYLSSFGLALIIFSFFVINDNLLNSYRLAIFVPSIGVFLILINKENKFPNIFGSKIFIFFGGISYSLYLWHQPILSFYKLYFNDQQNILFILFLLILMAILSLLTKIYIEDYFRNYFFKEKKFIRKKIFITLIVIIEIILTNISYLGNYTYGFPKRNSFFEKFTLNQIGLNKNCNGNLQFSSKCRTSDNPEIAVIGNSYAAHLISGLKENISDIKLIQFTYDGCSPFYFNDLKEKSSNNKCENFNKNVYAELNKDYLKKNLKYLIISGIENGFDNEQYKASLQKKLNFFKDNNIKIIIVGNLPLQINEVNFGRCFLLEKFKNGNFTNCNYSVGKIKPNAIVMNKKLKNFSQLNNFQYFDLINTLCPKEKCLISDINGFYINDIGHFTKHGSKIIINNLLKEKLLN